MPRQLQQQQQQQQQQHWPHPVTLADLALTSPSPWASVYSIMPRRLQQQQQQQQQEQEQQQLGLIPLRWSFSRRRAKALGRAPGRMRLLSDPSFISVASLYAGLRRIRRCRYPARKRVIQKPVIHEKSITAVRTRTVTSTSPRPAFTVCARGPHSSSDYLKATESAYLTTKTKSHGKENPVLPPISPNSWRAPNLSDLRALDLRSTTLRLARSDSDTSSRAIGTSFTVSASAEERSPGEEPSGGLSNSYTDTIPPDKRRLFEGGVLIAARHLQAIFRSGAADDEQVKDERTLREERVKKEEETGEEERSSCEKEGWVGGGGEARGNGEDRPGSLERVDLQLRRKLKSQRAPAGIISIHRRPSTRAASDPQANVDKAATVRRPPIHAPGTLRGTQSALELYRWTRVDHIFLSVHVHVHISGDYFRCRVFIYVHWETSEYPLFVYAAGFGLVSSTSTSTSLSTKLATSTVSDQATSDPRMHSDALQWSPARLQAFQRLLDNSRAAPTLALSSSGGGRSWNKPSPLSGATPTCDVNAHDWLGRASSISPSPQSILPRSSTPSFSRTRASTQRPLGVYFDPSPVVSKYSQAVKHRVLLLQKGDSDTSLKDYEGYTAFDLYNSTVERTKPEASGPVNMFAWGTNRNAALGLGDGADQHPAPHTQPLSKRFQPIRVLDVFMAKLHTAAVTAEPYASLHLALVSNSDDTHIIQVALGQDHTLVLMRVGSVLSWGLSRFSQLGYAVDGSGAGKEFVIGVAACKTASACWTAKELFTWGTNNAQLGYDMAAVPVQVLPRRVTQVA
ncbi:hypothetical protein DFH11DRAFT_1732702 [Phellopilus nigrolimitatus]|nr:hypothetical protein DFH11DRAFT_1732702 [Phellopilus nigrolimitatus]